MTTQTLLNHLKTQNIHATEVLQTLPLYQHAWEGDSEAWLVKHDDQSLKIYTTNHGRIIPWNSQAIKEYQTALEQNLENLQNLLQKIS